MGDIVMLWQTLGWYCNLNLYLDDIVKSDILLLKVIGHYWKMGQLLGDIVISPWQKLGMS
jgi:hypothetical protein